MNNARALKSAVEGLQANPNDPQDVHTNLVRIYDILASNVTSNNLVTMYLAPSPVVNVIQQLLQTHSALEEIQWDLAQVITLGCRASRRFQCEAGLMTLWADLYAVRIAHTESTRVLEATLRAYEAILDGLEFHEIQMRPLRRLVDEMLEVMDRCSTPPDRFRLSAPHYDFSRLVVLAFRVLCVVYSSSRVVTVLEAHENSLAARILDSMLAKLSHFTKSSDATRVWLRMCRLQLHQRRNLATDRLFASNEHPWFIDIIDRWAADENVVLDWCGLFTMLSAVPESVSSLVITAFTEHSMLRYLCNLLQRYARKTLSQGAAHDDRVVVEMARLVRQLTFVPSVLSLFPLTSETRRSLLPYLLSLLRGETEASCQEREEGTLRLCLDIILTLQRLITLHTYTSTLVRNDDLVITLGLLLKRISLRKSVQDNDTPSLLAMEIKKFQKQCVSLVPTSSGSNRSSVSGSLVRTASTKHQSSRRLLTSVHTPSRKSLVAATTGSIVVRSPSRTRIEHDA